MNALKGLVMAMGALIVLGMVFLVVGLYHKASNPDFRLFGTETEQAPRPASPSRPSVPAGQAAPPREAQSMESGSEAFPQFGDLSVTLPAGCRLTGVTPAGSRVFLLSDCDRVTVLDLASGKVLGTVSVKR